MPDGISMYKLTSSSNIVFVVLLLLVIEFTISSAKAKPIRRSDVQWDEEDNRKLIGYAQQVVDAPSLDACKTACLYAQEIFRFDCLSIVYYVEDRHQNCVLNSESRESHPEGFTYENANAIYFGLKSRRSENS